MYIHISWNPPKKILTFLNFFIVKSMLHCWPFQGAKDWQHKWWSSYIDYLISSFYKLISTNGWSGWSAQMMIITHCIFDLFLLQAMRSRTEVGCAGARRRGGRSRGDLQVKIHEEYKFVFIGDLHDRIHGEHKYKAREEFGVQIKYNKLQ